jgi:SAM-dependent methyltransferase
MKLYELSKAETDSWGKDLVKSKEWLADELAKIKTNFENVYILGSWYGNLSIVLFQERDIHYHTLYNVDVDKRALAQGQELADELGTSDIKSICADANYINYNRPSLVINTSINNIPNAGWFENIPLGTLVVLQSRNNDPGGVNACNSPAELSAQYPLTNVLYMDKLRLSNDKGSYARFMVIGVK